MLVDKNCILVYNCTDNDNRQHCYGCYSPDPFLSALQLASHSKLIVLVEDLFCWWGNWDIEMLRTRPRWNSFNRLTLRLILEELIDILATFIIYRYLICVFWLFSFYVLFFDVFTSSVYAFRIIKEDKS